MSSELSPSNGEFSFFFGKLERAMAVARMVDSSANRSSVVSVSAGGAKAMSLGMGSEPPEAVCSVFAARDMKFQVKTMGYRSCAKSKENDRSRSAMLGGSLRPHKAHVHPAIPRLAEAEIVWEIASGSRNL